MRAFLIISLLVVLTTFVQAVKWYQLDNYTFEDYVQEFQKVYPKEEYFMRKAIFESRLKEIQAHNRDPSKTWKKGVNHLTDHLDKEFKQLLGLKQIKVNSPHRSAFVKRKGSSIANLPRSIDWRDRNAVTPVKDQGRCGSCWTFAAAQAVESFWSLATGQLHVLSEQQLLDCTENPRHCGGSGGCQGGTSELAFDTVIEAGGIASEWTYPYISYHGQNATCRFSKSNTPPEAKISSYVVLPSNEYEPLMNAIATIGPVVVSVDASAWSSYEYGVFDGCNNNSPVINHAVQLVGYGTDPVGGDYWLIRNSWSPAWGEAGYMRIKRSSQPPCGINHHPEDGTGCDDGPPYVTVCGDCGILYDSSYPVVSTSN